MHRVGFTTHNRYTEGGRKAHLVREEDGRTECGNPEARGHLVNAPWGPIQDLADWLRLDVDDEVCRTCVRRATRGPRPRRNAASAS